MANFQTAYDKTRKIEGGYSNNAKDRGGETWNGIARNTHPSWSGWAIVDSLKRAPGFPGTMASHDYLNQLVHSFFKAEYWDVLSLDQVNDQDIANELFDTAVNMGTGTAAIFLQRSLNVSNRNGKYYADLPLSGHVGKLTLSAVNGHPRPRNVLKSLNCLQGAKYIALCEANPLQEEFYHGWMERVNEYCQ